MRLALLGYFDVGVSWGVEDAAFRSELVAAQPDIGMVGLRYPLGQGLVVELPTQDPALIGRWRAAARRQLLRPEMETGWDASLNMPRDEFHRGLAHHISTHPISRCELTIHAVGTVLAHLEFGTGIPRLFMKGMSQCFEFAAYVPSISLALLGIARDHATAAVDQDNRLAELSRRPPPRTETDADGYTESTLFTSFTDVITCIDEGDDRLLAGLLTDSGIDARKAIAFEYHGNLHYDWAVCVLEPKTLYGWVPTESPADQIARMFACIRMAHVFLGTSEIFVKLFLDETQRQVGGYVTGSVSGRSARNLNRLRTLALAVVNLTDFTLVTQSAEDQMYFKAFARDASLDSQRKLITEACEMLYNIQAAEQQEEERRRGNLLNFIVVVLTCLTLVSVSVDAYDFISGQEVPQLIGERTRRTQAFLQFVLGVALLLGLMFYAWRGFKVRQVSRTRIWRFLRRTLRVGGSRRAP